ncbi:MAG TPA: hypothetical protein VIY68_16210 [Steroidobacteraceae bacterium]
MATEAGTTHITAHQRFYFYALVCAAVILFIGFARTYFLKVFFDAPSLYPLLHIHGFMMTSWFLLFGIQTWLVEKRRIDLHRCLGVLGAILASMMLIFGAIVVTINAREGRVPDAAPIPVILILSYANLLVFGLLVGAAIFLRRRSEFHKRLMLLATLNLLSAAINRIPVDFIASGGVLAVFGLLDLFILICVLYDTARHRRLHPAFGWGALLSFLWPVLGIVLGGSSAGSAFATWVLNKAH